MSWKEEIKKNVDKEMLNKVGNMVSEALKMLNDSMNLRIDPVKQNTLRAEAIEKLKEVLLFTQ
jgi:methionyl-tRNA synthetase